MKTSTLCLLGSLLASTGALANGTIPVLELDFTRSATETLKKLGINDACIIAAAKPGAFTYCREGSTTLWKYQTPDLDRLAAPLTGNRQSLMETRGISIAEFESAACAEEHPRPLVDPAISRALALSLIILFICIGLRYTYRATMEMHFKRVVYPGTDLQRTSGYSRSNRSTTRALGAFTLAAGVAVVYFGYIAI
ncbi:hypothetical protein [Pseudomonas sp. NPDC089569]|uniref:hypothetical protein n=1 Tax=Pseudomonas sp. NPDC089569 TaxID=3390722 RepID=UPI003D00031E